MNAIADFNSRCLWERIDAVVYLTVATAGAGCSRQNAPTDPSAVAAGGETAHVHGGSGSAGSPNVNSQLATVRALTAKYHDVSAAVADGSRLGYKGVVTGCIANPTAGARGYQP